MKGDETSYMFLRNTTFDYHAEGIQSTVQYDAYLGVVTGKPLWFIDKVVVEDDRHNRYFYTSSQGCD